MDLPEESATCCECGGCGGDDSGVCTDCGCVVRQIDGAANTVADVSGTYASRLFNATGPTVQQGLLGNNTFSAALPQLVEDSRSTNVVAAVLGFGRIIRFDDSGGTFTPRNCNSEDFSLSFNSGNCEYVFIDNCSGLTVTFASDGRALEIQTAGGESRRVTAWTPDGEVARMERTVTVDGREITDSLEFVYEDGVLVSVTSRRSENPSAAMRRTLYSYYGVGEAHGNENDLKTVTQQIYHNGAWADHETSYYRYYKAGESAGFEHGLKYVVNSTALERLKSDPEVPDPFTASDEKVAKYADNYYEYDSQHRATKSSVRGGLLTYTFSYTASAFADATNNWHLKTVMTNPEGSQEIIFSNYLGQVMLRELTDGTNRWIDYTKYDSNSRIIEQATPAAIDMSGTPYDQGVANLNVQLKTADGLIHVTDYYTSTTATETTAGGVAGYVEFTKIKKGSSGTEIKQSQTRYFKRTVGSTSSFPVAEGTVYRDSAGAQPITTKYEYEWYTSQTQVKKKTTLFPIVPTSQNGTGTQESQVELYDLYDRVVWLQDARGFITYNAYNDLTSGMTQQIQDVDMTQMSGYPLNPGWVTPTGGGLHLITDYESDELGRTTQTLGPPHNINGQSTRTATWTMYKDLEDEILSAKGYATGTSTGYEFTLVNPVAISKTADDGSSSRTVSAVRTDESGKLSPADLFPQPTWIRWSEDFFNRHGQKTASREYYDIPETGEGTAGQNYNESTIGYDDMGRQNMSRTPGGTITRTAFDVRGQATQRWMGTKDAAATQSYPNGDSGNQEANAPSNNMKMVTSNEYDGGNDGGNGNLTGQTQHVDASTTRVTSYAYDFRDRRTDIDGEVDFYQINTYDNLDRVTQVQRKSTSISGNLIAQNETRFDDRNRTYQTIRYAVNPGNGAIGNTLTDNIWYDPEGNAMKNHPAGSEAFVKTSYDGIGRAIVQYIAYYDGTGADNPASLTDNKVFGQTNTTYDDATNVTVVANLSRYHDAAGTGALVAGTSARPAYSASWYDVAGRLVSTAFYGNQGNDSTAFTRPESPPESSNEVLVTQTRYNPGGEKFETVDAAGIVKRQEFDNAGRPVRTIENYVGSEVLPGEDRNVVTETSYNADGNILTLTAKNPATGDQVTTFIWGTTLTESDVAINQFLRAEIYPDAGDGGDQVTYAYNRQGQLTSVLDQNGSVHEFEYDPLGMRTVDKVTTVGWGVDNAILRIDTEYEVRGMANLVTSYDNAAGTGPPVNQVKQTYNDFAQLEKSEQEHDGAVDGSTLAVEYGYTDGSNNTIRPTTVTYPDGRVLTMEYGSGDDDKLSRIATLDWNGTDVSDYTYLGASTFVKEDYPVPSVALNYIGSGNAYSGFDSFGRVVDQKWVGGSGDVDQFTYGYDRNSNRTYRENVVAAAQTTPVHLDELYRYDAVNRLTASHRGELNDNARITDHALSQTWELDATGNWKQFSNYDQSSPADRLVQQRAHNEVNEITDIGETVGNQWVTPAHDRNGNMTSIPQPNDPSSSYTLIWDAWNRVVDMQDGMATVGHYTYDGLMRRIQKFVPGSLDSYQHFYYNAASQVVETRESSTAPVASSAQYQYVWSLRYIDAPVLRDDRAADPDEVLYYLSDANFNVTTLLNTVGTAVERYVYDPYGALTIYNGDWSVVRSMSEFANAYTFTGRIRDSESGLLYFRARYYDAVLGRFTRRDLLVYGGGTNLYRYVGNNPQSAYDPTGLIQITAECRRQTGNQIFVPASYPAYGTYVDEWEFDSFSFDTGLGNAPCPDGWELVRFADVPTTVDELIDNLADNLDSYPRCNDCTRGKLETMLENIRETAEATVPASGTLNPCERWCEGFAANSTNPWRDADCVYQSGCTYAFNIGPFGGHVVYRIVLCDGSIIYVDNGFVGGSDHVGLPSEAPATALLINPVWGHTDPQDWIDLVVNQGD